MIELWCQVKACLLLFSRGFYMDNTTESEPWTTTCGRDYKVSYFSTDSRVSDFTFFVS